jgi:hypothetical protein
MRELRQRNDAGARALEFTILTAARSGEVRGATAVEFDRTSAMWTIPASHMKGNRVAQLALKKMRQALANRADLEDLADCLDVQPK